MKGLIATYIMASGRNGTLYTGMTSDLHLRVIRHKQGTCDGFTRRYRCGLLAWYEPQASIVDAIQREKQIKRWLRNWKLRLIEDANPQWRDLSDGWFD